MPISITATVCNVIGTGSKGIAICPITNKRSDPIIVFRAKESDILTNEFCTIATIKTSKVIHAKVIIM